jgi:hypothetical protein
MPLIALGSLLAGWLLLITLFSLGALSWDNPWMWGPPLLFVGSSLAGGEMAMFDDENRGTGLLFLLLGIGSAMVHGVVWFYAFGLV